MRHPSLTRHYLRAVEHRIIRRRLWKWILRRQSGAMNDRDFLALLGDGESPEAVLNSFRADVETRLFFSPRNRKEFFAYLITSLQTSESILEEGQAVLDNKFQTLGSPLIALGDQINWQQDFKSGHEWPLRPSHALDILMPGSPSDVKVPWELGRFHQIWWLGKAYWISSQEDFARGFCHLIEDWIDHNPLGFGVQWSIAMEAAIRASNWICGYSFFCESPSIPPAFWIKFLKSLYTHGLYIWNNREYSLRNGNHYLSNIVGLLFLGVFFQNTPHGKRWLAWSVAELQKEMQREVTEDGVNYEKSTSYHRLVLELFSAAAALCRTNALDLRPPFWTRLEKMYEFLLEYSRPDGSVPMIGDADDGRFFRFRLSEPINDHRHLLPLGAVFFKRGDFKGASPSFSQDGLFLLGAEGFERYVQLPTLAPPQASRRFPEGGFVILRSPEVHILVDVGDIGMNGRGGHGHNDTLSFDLWARGAPLIVDPGTYVYTSDVEARQLFRSTRMHNTAMVAGKEIAEFKGLWQIEADLTHPRVRRWTTDDSTDVLEAEHSGYQRLDPPVIHRRTFTLAKRPFAFEIVDRFISSRPTTAEVYFHLHPGVSVEELRETSCVLRSGPVAMKVLFSHPVTRQSGWYSPSYGLRSPSASLCLTLAPSTNDVIQTRCVFL